MGEAYNACTAKDFAVFSCNAGITGSLLLREKGDHEVVDEELLWIYDTSSVTLRVPPSPTGEGFLLCQRYRVIRQKSFAVQKARFKPPGRCSPKGRAFYKFIVGEGSPLPKRDRILCFIHGRRNASPTRQICDAVG